MQIPLMWLVTLAITGGMPGIISCQDLGPNSPNLELSSTVPVTKIVGDDTLLTCVVTDQGDHTLMWKRTSKTGGEAEILTANTARVTSDHRVKVLHETDGQVYVLVIANVTAFDAGLYYCEVNSDPPVRSMHELKVLTNYEPITISTFSSNSTTTAYNFTSCCMSKNVSNSCMKLCSLDTVLDKETSSAAWTCKEDMGDIMYCMADGRNHMPCCQAAGMPEICSQLCQGQYSGDDHFNFNILSYCSAWAAPTLACITAGIETIPHRPEGISVDAVNDTAISVTWTAPHNDIHLRDHYAVNVTYVKFLTAAEFDMSFPSKSAKKYKAPYSIVYTAGKNDTQLTIGSLEKFAVYEVSMWAENLNGEKSLPSYSVKVVTLMEGETKREAGKAAPFLPDVRGCCQKKNVTIESCLNEFCDPHKVASISQEDMMVCAPWDTSMFWCLADGKDHSPCCADKGLPPVCQELCSGQVTNINYRHFGCIEFMSELSSCMLDGYGVLPSSPQHLKVSNTHSDFAILHWDQPATLADSVLDYTVVYQKINTPVGLKWTVPTAHSPFILEQLESKAVYEVFVEAVNDHGRGKPSSRVVFETHSKTSEIDLSEGHPYNQTQCCVKSGIQAKCLSLCSYDVSTFDVVFLANDCIDDFSKLVRCASGGRDHKACCKTRGVPEQCQPLCQAVHQESTGAELSSCLPYVEEIFSCYEEGTAQLPPPVRDLKAVSVEDGNVTLAWKFDNVNSTFNIEHFEVFYKQVSSLETAAEVFDSDKQINTKDPLITIVDLEVGKIYRFFVVSRNSKGTSLPSSIVTVTISSDAWKGNQLRGATSPPHQLRVDRRATTWVQFSWNPPAISHPEDVLKFKLYYFHVGDEANLTLYKEAETENYAARLIGLEPGTQYAAFVTAIIIKNETEIESNPSEEIVMWTETAVPATVEIHISGNHPFDKLHAILGKLSGRSQSLARLSEGGFMTVQCIATGMPVPRQVLSINGVVMHSQVTRHMMTVIHNVHKDINHISCLANNGYGTPTQATRTITVRYAPTITAPMNTTVMAGDTLTLRCTVEAYPPPTLAFFRDRALKQNVVDSERVSITAQAADNNDINNNKYFLTLKIKRSSIHDGNLYYCHANNTEGEKIAMMGVTVEQWQPPPSFINVTDCCIHQNVTKDCLDICSFSMDFDTMLRKPQCITQFHKLMSCAADYSDHRHCCSTGGVPTMCLNWCRGEVVVDTFVCALDHSRTIVGCFHEGKQNLPGTPVNLAVTPLDQSSATVTWGKPTKNPDSVETYRVFWRREGAFGTNRSDINGNKLVIDDLESDTAYEVTVKAGNANGTSQLTDPVFFRTVRRQGVLSASLKSNAGKDFGFFLVVLVIVGVIVSVLYVLHKRNLIVCIVKRPDRLPVRPSFNFQNTFSSIINKRGPIHNTEAVEAEQINIPLSISEMSSSSSETSSESVSPRSEEGEGEVKAGWLDKLRAGVGHGQGFERFK